jgi:hypothetical protein
MASCVLVITCHVRYEIDPSKLEAFEQFARAWIRDDTGCVRRFERSFLRPLLP